MAIQVLRHIPPYKENICALIVTYYPDREFPERVKKIARQVAHIIIVDNGSDQHSRLMLHNLTDINNINLIENERNMGIATALNQGICWLKDRGYQWVLTLDQDTVPFDFMIETLLQVYNNLEQKDKVAIIGSNYYTLMNKSRYQFGINSLYVEKKSVITSGSLISIAAFNIIGPFRDEFFIDHVDHEYCLRARAKGFKIIMACEPIMRHMIGEATKHRLLLLTLEIEKHPANRYYFKSRNHAIIIREYFFKDPIWILKSIYSAIKSIFLTCLFEEKKLLKLKLTIKGYIHGAFKYFVKDPENIIKPGE